MFLSAGVATFVDGEIEISDFEGTGDLTLDEGVGLPPELEQLYGWADPDQEWRSLGLSPRFPVNAEVASRMWTGARSASGRRRVVGRRERPCVDPPGHRTGRTRRRRHHRRRQRAPDPPARPVRRHPGARRPQRRERRSSRAAVHGGRCGDRGARGIPDSMWPTSPRPSGRRVRHGTCSHGRRTSRSRRCGTHSVSTATSARSRCSSVSPIVAATSSTSISTCRQGSSSSSDRATSSAWHSRSASPTTPPSTTCPT